MTDSEFIDWSNRYCAVFNMKLEWVSETLKAWRGMFDAGRFSTQEVNAALEKMVLAPKEKDQDRDHIRTLTRILREGRTLSRSYEQSSSEVNEEKFGTCTLCKSGYVTVPDRRCVSDDGVYSPYRCTRDGDGTFYEKVVYCRCGLGRFLDTHQEEYWKRKSKERGTDCRPWTLDRYEQFNPDWRVMLEEHAAFEEALWKARKVKDVRPAEPMQVVAMVAQSLVMPAASQPEESEDDWLRTGAQVSD